MRRVLMVCGGVLAKFLQPNKIHATACVLVWCVECVIGTLFYLLLSSFIEALILFPIQFYTILKK